MHLFLKNKNKISLVFGFMLLFFTTQSFAAIEKIHFIIPGGAGGGWDGTARGTGEALKKSGLIKNASFENMSGGGGGKAIAHMIETADRQAGTLMVSSTPIVVRSLKKVFPQSFRDLTPVAGVIADYGAIVVRDDSKYTKWSQVVADFKNNPSSVKIGGGSSFGSLDHLVAVLAFKKSGVDFLKVKYIPYGDGGKAMAGLLSGEVKLISTGLGEALDLAKQGAVRILAITAEERIADAPNVMTLKEQGVDAVFANWRGFFGSPKLTNEQSLAYQDLLGKMYATPEWEVVRTRNGWVNQYIPGDKFYTFLEQQEVEIGDLIRELGFIK